MEEMKMKKIISIAFAAILAGFAISCQKEEAVSDKADAVQYTFNITVNDRVGFDSEVSTKGATAPTYKSAWENGDKIFLFFKPTSGNLLTDTYATLTYNEGSWNGAKTGTTSLGNGGTLSAVYVYKLDGSVTPAYTDSKWTIATGNTFYNCQTGVIYTVSGNEISASLDLKAPDDFVCFSIYDTSGDALTCDKVKGWKDVVIGSEMTFSNATCTGYMTGFDNIGGSNYKDYYGRIVGGGTTLKGVTCKFSVVKGGKVYERTATPSSDKRSFYMDRSATDDKKWTEAEGKLPGLFTIGKGTDGTPGTEDDVQVRFSQGNLWYGKVGSATTATFNFEANQYDSTPSANGSWSTSHVSHFFWSKTPSVAYAQSYSDAGASDNDVFFTNQEGFKVSVGGTEQTGWRTLSQQEWEYLFKSRTNASSLYKYGVTVCGKTNCLIIAPDNWDTSANPLNASYDATAWATAEAAGLVCLPAAGRREVSSVGNVGSYGDYWSSTTIGSDTANFFYFPNTPTSSRCNRDHYSYSVRLVTECQ